MKTQILLHLALFLPASGFSPVLSRMVPPGGQFGSEVEVRFHGERLGDVTAALFYQPGLSLSAIETKDGKLVTARLAIAPDAPPGEHSLRLAGPGGITELRSFWVGAFPVVDETEPNPPDKNPQRVELNRTIHGIAGNEDEDAFLVTLKQGQRLSAEVEAMRLGRTMFDASLAILDSRGFELATCDDAPLLRTDAFVSILAPADGDYRVVVREAAYEGNDQCQYRLHIGTIPRPCAVFPPGGKPGETIDFTFIGDPSGPISQTFTLPADERADFPLFPSHDGLTAPSPLWIAVSPLEAARDSETSHEMKSAVPLPPTPCAAHGVIDPGKPADWFRISAKKGEALVLRAIARAHRSPLDPVLSIHAADGKFIAANDDQGGPDSVLPWTCPADGEYLVQIRDQLRRSGADFTYRIEITGRQPAIAANLPTVERVNSQKWKTFPVPRGNRYAAVVNITRENTACDAAFAADTLPPGVTMTTGRIPRGVNSFPVVFEATPDAPEAASLHAFQIRSEGLDPPLTGRLTDTIHHIDINNQGAYHSTTLDRIAMAVTRPAPFRVELETPPAPIVRDGRLALKIRAERQPGFSGKITARFLWSPPGISGPTTIEIPGDKPDATCEINASADAAVGDWQVCILAEADTPDGPLLASSALVPLKIAEPYVALTLDLAAAQPGQPSAMLAKIETLRPFTGPARAEITGLPHGVTGTPQEFTSQQTEITFPLQVAADARPGKHSGLSCTIRVPENGSDVIHRSAANGTLRIDLPPKEPDKPAPQAAAKPDATPAAKPLSRLEQLRQRAK